jgi:hypothetical protein
MKRPVIFAPTENPMISAVAGQAVVKAPLRTKMLKTHGNAVLVAALVFTAALPAFAQNTSRIGKMVPKQTIAKQTKLQVPRLSVEQLQQRAVIVPRFLGPRELQSRIPQELLPPSLSTTFSLTPATTSVAGRGTLTFARAQMFVPNPLPPGASGMATVRTQVQMRAPLANQWQEGNATLKFNARRGLFYAIDCSVVADWPYVKASIWGNDTPLQDAMIDVKDDRIVLAVRRSESDGEINIRLQPGFTGDAPDVDPGLQFSFFGCQISSSG